MSRTRGDSVSGATIFAVIILSLLSFIGVFIGLYYAYSSGIIKMPNLKMPNLNVPNINIQSASTVSSTPNIYESTNEVSQQQPTTKSCKINEDLPAFPKGTEPLVEPDSSEA